MISSEALSGIKLLEGVSAEQLSRLASICKGVGFSTGERIFDEGEKAENLYILLEGKVAIQVSLTSRPETITVTIINKPHASFGWSGVVAPYHYTAAALCREDCRLIAVPGKRFIDILAEEPRSGFVVMRRISEVISDRLRNSHVAFLKTL